MSIKKGLKKSKKILLAIGIPFLAVAVGVSALVGAILGAGDNSRMPAGDLADSTAIESGATNITIGANGKIDTDSNKGVTDLIHYIGGSNTATYASIAGSLTTPINANKLKDRTVTLGGIVWNIMYVSKADETVNGTDKGDVIVTLWQASSTSGDNVYMSNYAEGANSSYSLTYPSAMYGASTVRSTLVGSQYANSAGTALSTVAQGTQKQNAHWKPFTTASTEASDGKGFAEMLATPANMNWQKTQSSYAVMKYGWRFPNDSWAEQDNTFATSAPSNKDSWYGSSATENTNYYDNSPTTYSAWKNDKLWLPSMVETGWGASNTNTYGTAGSGLWNASQEQRKTGISSGNGTYAWLRSGDISNAYYAYLLYSSGSNNNYYTTFSYAVRPALHLNLKSAAQAAGALEQKVTYHTAIGTAPAKEDYTVSSTLKTLTIPNEYKDTLEFAGWAKGSVNGTVITSLSNQSGNIDLYATFKPKAATFTTTPADTNIGINYGATNVTMSAAISHALLQSGQLTVSTYWRYNGGSTNIAAESGSDGITLTDGANPSLVLTRPARSRAGKYTLYYTLTPSAAEAEKGVKPLTGQKVADFDLTVYGAAGTVAEKPTLSPSQIYVGQPISGTQLTGGRVSCATAGIDNVAGTWQITSTGVFTSSGKIYAKFTPDDEDIAPITGVQIDTNAQQLYLKMTEDVSGIIDRVVTAKPAADIPIDYNTAIGFTILDNKVTFTVKQDGVAGKTVDFPINAHAGYTSFIHLTSDEDKEEITSSSPLLANVTTDRVFTISYQGADTDYTVYYLLDGISSDFPEATTASALDALIAGGSQYVYKSTVQGATGSQVKYLSNGLPFNATLASRADIDQRELNAAKTGALKKVMGDGSTVQLIYLGLKKYNVSFAASGASPSVQNIEYKYGAAILGNAGITEPAKELGTFAGWYFDEDYTNEVGSGDVVNGSIQVYAKFDAKPFTLVFDMNVGEGKNQIDLPHVISVNSAKLAGGKIAWDTSVMFNGFDFRADNLSEGRYLITYDTNNITSSTKSITATKPSAIGYTFLGWYASEAATAQTSVIYKPTKTTKDEITLTARWEPATYNVIFDLRDGSNTTTVKSIKNLSLWGNRNESQEFTPAGNVLPTVTGRSGYTFMGWYVTAAAAAAAGEEGEGLSIYNTSAQPDEDGNVYFSITNFAEFDAGDGQKLRPYGNAADGYNFGNLTLYAGWKSVDVYIKEVNKSTKGKLSFTNAAGESISTETDAVHIGDKITITPSAIEPDPMTGYQFKSLTAGNQEPKLKDGVLTFTITGRDVADGADGKLYLNVEAVFSEATFTITYHSDGGRIADTSFKRTYKASDFVDGQESNIKMPSKVTKRGYEFDGWIFESTADDRNPQLAHRQLQSGEVSFFGLDLRMVQAVDDDQNLTYRNVTLMARWKAQPAFVYLYNAHYNGEYNKPDNAGYYLIDDVVTDQKIDVSNPSRGDSFVFLGWATTRNGAVVYPVVEGEDTISYTVSADVDENGAALNHNNLYAVWRVADLDYVIMSATNNGCTYTYGGDGIQITAKPSRNYDTGITLTYKWYKVLDGMYNQCFVTKDYVDKDGFKWYLDGDGIIKAYEKENKFYDENKQLIGALPDGVTKLTFSEFDSSSVGTACVQKNPTTNSSALTVRNVADCGIYICVVEVTGGENEGQETQHGEIEISMNKAVYGGLSLEDKKTTYNSKPLGGATVQVKGLNEGVENGLKTITLPDGSKVNVTYRYFVGDGELRREITDLNLIKNVGVYHVEASFAFAVGGDKGNYEELKTLEADLYIEADEISHLEFVFTHNGVKSDLDFSGVYDGNAYGVEVVIKDTFGTGGSLVTAVDDVAVEFEVYRVYEDGDEPVTAPTTEAGKYIVVIVGLTGEGVDNYVLGELAETSKVYTITKKVYDVAGHISFDDDPDEVYDDQLHTISIKIADGFELPSTVSVSYEVLSYIPEAEDFSSDANVAPDGNGGIHAGTYTIKVTFTDSASANYEALESLTATLTIKQANLFDFYNRDGADLLRDAGFVNASYAYDTTQHYNPYIKGGLLNDKENFEPIVYEYYRVLEENGVRVGRTLLASGTYEQLKEDDSISLAGKYEIVAIIGYDSALYRNNFAEIPEADRTITYVIREMAIMSVNVVEWKDGFDMVAYLGDGFDYSWIKKIEVEYESEIPGKSNTLTVTKPADIALAGIILEKKNGAEQNTFWHVGSFNVIVSFYGTKSVAYKFTVKEKVQSVVLKYSTGAGYAAVPDEGLEQLTDGTTYSFLIEYGCTNESGAFVTKTSEAIVAAGGLVLGKNVLTVTEGYYTFDEEAAVVNLYKVIGSVTWEYSLDGENWNAVPEDGELVYAGKEYRIRAAFEDGGETQYGEATAKTGVAVLNADGYRMQVGRSGNYKITAEYPLTIAKKVLEFTWDTAELGYNTWHRSPKVEESNLEEADKDLITFGYEYYQNGVLVTSDKVVSAGEYEVLVVLRGDATARGNYTLEGSATAAHGFKIVRADIVMTAVYSESNYGENSTFAGNSRLRLGAMKADFGENAAVTGKFRFITDYDEESGEYEIVEDETSLSTLIANQGYKTLWYVYVPDDKNYKDKIGSIQLNVLEQTPKSGAGALSVEFGKDAVQFYLVNQEFDTHGIEVYKLYESAYQERGEWYGLRTRVEAPSFRIGNMAAQGYKITAQDLSSEKVVLRALSGSDSGTLDVSVVDKTATGLEISSTNHRTEYYVGETPDFADIEFRVLFGVGEMPQEGLRIGTIKTDFNQTLTEEGTFTVEFTYFNVTSKPYTFTVKAKDGLQIVKPTNTVLTYRNGETLDAPEIGFMVDGVRYGQNGLDGVKVIVAVYRDGKLARLAEEGEYTVRYSFEITNPRFNGLSYVDVPVTVTKNPYKVEITVRDGESASYTGNPIAIPKPEVGAVTDSTNGDKELPANRVSKVYTINGREVDINRESDWLVVNRGAYEVQVTVKVLLPDSEPYTASTVTYTFTVTQAENDASHASVDAKIVVLGEGADFNFKVTADFGADTAVLEYSSSRDGEYSTEKPTAAGTYYVRAVIAATENYKGLTSVEVPFEVRNAAIDAGESGSISGGNGIGENWSLEIKQMEAEAVSQESISKQNVLDGYEVVLKNSNGVAVSGEGEYTVRVKLTDELSGTSGLKVFFKNADGKTVEKKATVKDGYIEFKTSEFGTFIITTAVAGAPVGLLVAVIVLGAVAAAGVATCIIVFVKKKKKGAQ